MGATGSARPIGPHVTISSVPMVTTLSSCTGCEVHVYTAGREVDGGPLIARLQDAAEGRYGPLDQVTFVPVIREGEAARR